MWCWLLPPTAAGADTPLLTEKTAPQLAEAHSQCRAALQTLERRPKARQALKRALGALRLIEGGLDVYFHDPTLAEPDRRPHALSARPIVQRLLSPEGGLFVYHHDALSLRARHRRTLVEACRAQRRFGCVASQLEALLALEGPDEALLEEMLVVYQVLGQRRDQEATRLALAALRSPAGQGLPTVDEPKTSP